MINWLQEFAIATATFNTMWGFVIYWIPLAVCIVGYTIRTIQEYGGDFHKRKKADKDPNAIYRHSLTLGDIFKRMLMSICPLVNFGCACFDIFPEVFTTFFDWIGRIFNQPLVPERKDKK